MVIPRGRGVYMGIGEQAIVNDVIKSFADCSGRTLSSRCKCGHTISFWHTKAKGLKFIMDNKWFGHYIAQYFKLNKKSDQVKSHVFSSVAFLTPYNLKAVRDI